MRGVASSGFRLLVDNPAFVISDFDYSLKRNFSVIGSECSQRSSLIARSANVVNDLIIELDNGSNVIPERCRFFSYFAKLAKFRNIVLGVASRVNHRKINIATSFTSFRTTGLRSASRFTI